MEHPSSQKFGYANRVCFLSLLLLFIFIFGSNPNLYSAVMIHQYDFDGNLNDTAGTGDPLTIHPNTATSGFGDSEWWWTATTSPGGGLILNTNITDP